MNARANARPLLTAALVVGVAVGCPGCPRGWFSVVHPKELPVQEAPPRVREVLDRWHAAAQARRNVYAEFRWVTEDRTSGDRTVVQGSLRYARDGRLRIDFDGEMLYLFADDGKFYRLLPGDRRVLVRHGPGAASLREFIMQYPACLWVAWHPPDLPRRAWKLSLAAEKADAVKLEGEGVSGELADGRTYHFDPVTVWLSKRNWLPEKIVIDGGRPHPKKSGRDLPLVWDEARDHGTDMRRVWTVQKIETDVTFNPTDFKPPALPKNWSVEHSRDEVPKQAVGKEAGKTKAGAAAAK